MALFWFSLRLPEHIGQGGLCDLSSPPMPTRSSFMSNYLQINYTKFMSALLVFDSVD